MVFTMLIFRPSTARKLLLSPHGWVNGESENQCRGNLPAPIVAKVLLPLLSIEGTSN